MASRRAVTHSRPSRYSKPDLERVRSRKSRSSTPEIELKESLVQFSQLKTTTSLNTLNFTKTKHSFSSVSQKCMVPPSSPRAVGFLSMVETATEKNEQDKMLYDFNILVFLFPGFPKAMMKALIVREEGNMRAVAEYLKMKGWGQTTKVDLISTISNSTSLHFKIPYFWGKFKRNHLKILAKYDCGYYFTCFAYPNNYYLCCVNTKGETTKVPLESPKVPQLYEQLFSLTHPIPRPESISIHDLVFLDNV